MRYTIEYDTLTTRTLTVYSDSSLEDVLDQYRPQVEARIGYVTESITISEDIIGEKYKSNRINCDRCGGPMGAIMNSSGMQCAVCGYKVY